MIVEEDCCSRLQVCRSEECVAMSVESVRGDGIHNTIIVLTIIPEIIISIILASKHKQQEQEQ